MFLLFIVYNTVFMEFIKIFGVMKSYDWGTYGYLSSIFGGDDKKREAEYWMGTHKSGEATVISHLPLSKIIGHRLSFLFKVLSIDSPLSLQCHPNKKQAEEGWKREEKLREDGEPYNYQDDNEKAEILAAITPVTALCGFREYLAIKEELERYLPLSYEKYLSAKSDIKEIFLTLFALEENDKLDVLEELKRSLERFNRPLEDGEFLTRDGIISETLQKYSGDIGSVFPLMMNLIHLEPSQAIYLSPDTLHAYIKGNGVELMTASDNVLRGGLTKKRVDLKELEKIMSFSTERSEKTPKETVCGIVKYITPSPDFVLSYLNNGFGTLNSSGDTILLVLEGEAEITFGSGSVKIKRGECYYVKNDSSLFIESKGLVFIASEKLL